MLRQLTTKTFEAMHSVKCIVRNVGKLFLNALWKYKTNAQSCQVDFQNWPGKEMLRSSMQNTWKTRGIHVNHMYSARFPRVLLADG